MMGKRNQVTHMSLKAEGLADFRGVIEAARVMAALARLQWEYQFLSPTDGSLEQVQALGLAGWELVGELFGKIVLKRPRLDI